MKRLTDILITFLLMVLLSVMACGRGGGDTVTVPALLEAERLLSPKVDAADSALRVLRAVDTAALTTAGDRALYALLHTQALYKLTDDPIDTIPILRAVDHYATTQPGSDRHVRALTYAGAAAESNGAPVAAMRLYKSAELTADTAKGGQTLLYDFAYVEMRIGCLLKQQINVEKRDIAALKKALTLFERIGERKYLTACTFELGTSYAATDFDSCVLYLDSALAMTKERRDTSFIYDCTVRLANAYAMGLKRYDKSLALLDSARLLSHPTTAMTLLCEALCRANMGEPVKAHHLVEMSYSYQYQWYDTLEMHLAMEAIALAEGNAAMSDFHRTRAQCMIDSLELRSRPLSLVEQANAVHSRHMEDIYDSTISHSRILLLSLSALFLVCIICFSLRVRRVCNEREMLVSTLSDVEARRLASMNALLSAKADLADIKQQIVDLKSDSIDKEARMLQMEVSLERQQRQINELTIAGFLLNEINDNIQIKGQPKGLKNILSLHVSNIRIVELSDEFWQQLYIYVNSRFNGLLSHITANYPMVSEKDIRLIGLTALDIGNIIIAKLLGYSSTQTVRNMKSSLLRRKTDLDTNIETMLSEWRTRGG